MAPSNPQAQPSLFPAPAAAAAAADHYRPGQVVSPPVETSTGHAACWSREQQSIPAVAPVMCPAVLATRAEPRQVVAALHQAAPVTEHREVSELKQYQRQQQQQQ
jgi:hypothetical protein